MGTAPKSRIFYAKKPYSGKLTRMNPVKMITVFYPKKGITRIWRVK